MAPKIYTKKVLLPITVPYGNYCFGSDIDGETRCCEHFDNENGQPTCALNIVYDIKKDKNGNYLKPDKCLTLKEVLW